MRKIRKQPRLNALFGALDIASEHIRRARRAEIKAIFIAVFVMVAEDEIIQLIFRRHILQPAHILRKILAFKSRVNLNLIPITLRQLPNAVQVLAQLQNAHAHAGMGKPVQKTPAHQTLAEWRRRHTARPFRWHARIGTYACDNSLSWFIPPNRCGCREHVPQAGR